MKSLSLLAGVLLCGLSGVAFASDTLYLEPSNAADTYYAGGDSPAHFARDNYHSAGNHQGAAGNCSTCGSGSGGSGSGSGCNWGCCDRPCTRNANLWDGYCEGKDYSSWTFGGCNNCPTSGGCATCR